ncbi:MAG: serine hydrolase [Pseudomonadales bacterium]|nr:serine hydrolase [Pseudomonadales bacterium]
MSRDPSNRRISFCVLHRDGRVLHQALDVLPIYSTTKTIIARTIHLLGIDPNARISEWIEKDVCPHPIRVKQLLNHTSGLIDYGALPAYNQAIAAGVVWDDQTFGQHTLQRPLLTTPGLAFAYSNPGYWLLKKIIEQVTNQTFAETISRLIFEPLEMNSAYVAEDQFAPNLPRYPAGWVWHGLVMSNALDVAKFLCSLDAERYMDNAFPVGEMHPTWHDPHYGNGLMIEPGEHFGHYGGGPGYSAAAMHFLKTGVTACVLESVSDPAAPDPAATTLFKLVEDLGY